MDTRKIEMVIYTLQELYEEAGNEVERVAVRNAMAMCSVLLNGNNGRGKNKYNEVESCDVMGVCEVCG
jgi:hypothetical protein